MDQRIANRATVVIALCALGFSAWQGYLQRAHNHVSLEPRLNAYFKIDGRADQWGVYIVNNGTGPAFVEALKVTVNGKPVAEGRIGQFGSAAVPLGLDLSCLIVGGPRPNDSLKVGEEVGLIETPVNAPARCTFNKLKMESALKDDLNFLLVVKSIYGDRFEYDYKNNIQRPL